MVTLFRFARDKVPTVLTEVPRGWSLERNAARKRLRKGYYIGRRPTARLAALCRLDATRSLLSGGAYGADTELYDTSVADAVAKF
jgi:hypothetical protein